MRKTRKNTIQSRMIRRVRIPHCRDPFVNTPLISVGCDEDGIERFWISTWNDITGCFGALVSENGHYRLYKFYQPKHPGFYSAVAEDEDTLWLCGNLSCVVRLGTTRAPASTALR